MRSRLDARPDRLTGLGRFAQSRPDGSRPCVRARIVVLGNPNAEDWAPYDNHPIKLQVFLLVAPLWVLPKGNFFVGQARQLFSISVKISMTTGDSYRAVMLNR